MPSIEQQKFGRTPAGQEATLYTLTNDHGNTLKVTDWGGIITSIVVNGEEMVIGYDTLAPYLAENPYYGALVGRYGNRIAGAKFTLDGKVVDLAANENENQLHGGPQGFNKVHWSGTTQSTDSAVSVVLTHESPDGDQGFPGRPG